MSVESSSGCCQEVAPIHDTENGWVSNVFSDLKSLKERSSVAEKQLAKGEEEEEVWLLGTRLLAKILCARYGYKLLQSLFFDFSN